jgi:hypothetical protein
MARRGAGPSLHRAATGAVWCPTSMRAFRSTPPLDALTTWFPQWRTWHDDRQSVLRWWPVLSFVVVVVAVLALSCARTAFANEGIPAGCPPSAKLGFSEEPEQLQSESTTLRCEYADAEQDLVVTEWTTSTSTFEQDRSDTEWYGNPVSRWVDGVGYIVYQVAGDRTYDVNATLELMISGGSASGCGSATPPSGSPDAYRTPPSWTTLRLTEKESETPGFEPLNVIFSACSTVSFDHVMSRLGSGPSSWTDLVPCVSPEKADVNGTGYQEQDESWRLGGNVGCFSGNLLSAYGEEDHARAWQQTGANGQPGAWFISASRETACFLDPTTKKMVPVLDHIKDFAKNFGSRWHCIDGSEGGIGSDGYNAGAKELVSDIKEAAPSNDWRVMVTTTTGNSGFGEGHDRSGPAFSSRVYVVTVMTLQQQSA